MCHLKNGTKNILPSLRQGKGNCVSSWECCVRPVPAVNVLLAKKKIKHNQTLL